jgi:hypothetical protein
MIRKFETGSLIAVFVLATAIPSATAQTEYPIMEKVAQNVIAHYQSSSCEQLAAERMQSKSGGSDPIKQKAVQLLRNDPQMRQQFFGIVAGPIVNKLFECGMIP